MITTIRAATLGSIGHRSLTLQKHPLPQRYLPSIVVYPIVPLVRLPRQARNYREEDIFIAWDPSSFFLQFWSAYLRQTDVKNNWFCWSMNHADGL